MNQSKKNLPSRFELVNDKFEIYISIYQHLIVSIHHHIDRTEVWDKRRRILIVVSTKVICYQIMKVTSFWTISIERREKKTTQEHSSLNYPDVCVLDRSIFGGNYPMTFVQAGFCCDAYEKNPTVVVIMTIMISSKKPFFCSWGFRDRVSSFDELPILSLIDLN